MQTLCRRGLLRGLPLAATTIALGVATLGAAASAQPAEIIVTTEPPAPRVEVIPVLPANRIEREVWQPGYWRWDGRGHVWVDGRYMVRPRPAAIWVPARWERRPGGWVYIEGHWGA